METDVEIMNHQNHNCFTCISMYYNWKLIIANRAGSRSGRYFDMV